MQSHPLSRRPRCSRSRARSPLRPAARANHPRMLPARSIPLRRPAAGPSRARASLLAPCAWRRACALTIESSVRSGRWRESCNGGSRVTRRCFARSTRRSHAASGRATSTRPRHSAANAPTSAATSSSSSPRGTTNRSAHIRDASCSRPGISYQAPSGCSRPTRATSWWRRWARRARWRRPRTRGTEETRRPDRPQAR